MELTLTHQEGTQAHVTCDNQPSHTFDIRTLIPDNQNKLPHPLNDPITYGKAIHTALFPPQTTASRALTDAPERILLVTTDDDLDAIPWEYAYGPYGTDDTDDFLVLACHVIRGLPVGQRIDPPKLESSLHIIAVPSNPLSRHIAPLNIDGEWTRLKEIIRQVPYALTLERTRPPTMEQTRRLLANQRQRVIHFMGHGGQDEKQGAFLCFEKENGTLDPVTAREFIRRVRGTVFLVTLNACVSATPGETRFANLAAALVRQKIPYALGMRFSIEDEDARAFSRAFYSELARGISIEEALFQARQTLAGSSRNWAIGVPVLYTSLAAPAPGFTCPAGTPTIAEHQAHTEVSNLPRAVGTFQGRINELIELGSHLTGDQRPALLTIHGSGGQGKTALGREAVERFAWAWLGGVYATSLENLPSWEVLITDLARFLNLAPQQITDPAELERQVLSQLAQHRTLIVLDNAETLVDAVHANNEAAIHLAQLLQERLMNPLLCLLITSRTYLGWSGEVGLKHDLTGLAPAEEASLFQQSAPQRMSQVHLPLAEELSQKVDGHPLSLRLLGGAFNNSAITLPAFIQDCETQLLQAENKYLGPEHRHRTLYACIDTSIRYLDSELRTLLSKLWIFLAPFLPEIAVEICEPTEQQTEDTRSLVYDQLFALRQRGLLNLEETTLREGTVQLYRLLPTIRPYIERYLARAEERETLLARFGRAYAGLVRFLDDELRRGGVAAFMAVQCREDLERGMSLVTGEAQGYYLLDWGWVLWRLLDSTRGLALTEQALEMGQSLAQQALKLHALNNLAAVYQDIGQPQRALQLYEQALPVMREVGDRAGEAATLNNLAEVYRGIGQPQRALQLYEQALPLRHEVGDRAGEATTLNNLAAVYQGIGQPQRALQLYEQALPLMREVGDRAGEATTLNNLALVYQDIGQPQRALQLYEQALPLTQEVGDRAGEATTLNNLAEVYRGIGQPQRALQLYEQALPLRHEVGDRAGEASTLNNLALVYQDIGQPQRALQLYEQALPLRHEVGDRAGEASTLNGLAYLFIDMQRYKEALIAFEQSVELEREVNHPAGEVAGLVGLALLLYRHLNRPREAITRMQEAIAVLRTTGLPQDAAGQTVENLLRLLETMRAGGPLGGQATGPSTLPAEQIELIVSNTVAVMTSVQDRRAEWRETVAEVLHDAQQRGGGLQNEVDFFTSILAVLDGQAPGLADDHPYAPALRAIQEGIAAGGLQEEEDGEDDELPFGDELIPRSIAALAGGPQEKMAYVQYLTELSTRTTDAGLKALIQVIQLALFGGNLSQVGQNLSGVYKEAWEMIVVGVEAGGVDPRLLSMIAQNTVAVLGPAAEQRGAWRDTLVQIKSQVQENVQLVALLDAVIGLLDTGGKTEGLGVGLTGIYAQVWQAIEASLVR